MNHSLNPRNGESPGDQTEALETNQTASTLDSECIAADAQAIKVSATLMARAAIAGFTLTLLICC